MYKIKDWLANITMRKQPVFGNLLVWIASKNMCGLFCKYVNDPYINVLKNMTKKKRNVTVSSAAKSIYVLIVTTNINNAIITAWHH